MEKQGCRSWRIDEDEGLVTQKEKLQELMEGYKR